MAEDFTLLPADDEAISADDALDAAEASALEDPGALPDADEPPIPFGRTWAFDFDTGRFKRHGGAPAEVRGFRALEQWCLMAAHSARFAHAVFSDEFGMEDPNVVIGRVDIEDAASDWKQGIAEALLIHDRIVAVENFDIHWHAQEGVLHVHNFEVVTDEEERVSVGPTSIALEA